jgi:predicted transcriptional regulator
MKGEKMPKYLDIQFTLKLPRDIGEKLNELAEKSGQTRNYVVTVAVAQFLATNAAKEMARREQ